MKEQKNLRHTAELVVAALESVAAAAWDSEPAAAAASVKVADVVEAGAEEIVQQMMMRETDSKVNLDQLVEGIVKLHSD